MVRDLVVEPMQGGVRGRQGGGGGGGGRGGGEGRRILLTGVCDGLWAIMLGDLWDFLLSRGRKVT